jgi:hypothetical protein
MFNTNFGYVSSHNLVLFLFCSCNEILLNFCFAFIVFLSLFFLFHNLDLGLTCTYSCLGLGNFINLVVFVPMTVGLHLHLIFLAISCIIQFYGS